MPEPLAGTAPSDQPGAAPADPVAEAVARALDFLFVEPGALAAGEVPLTVRREREGGAESPDRSLFATALAVEALAGVDDPRVASFVRRAAERIAAAREPGGVWRFWPAGHPRFAAAPPDLDDTVAAALALGVAGVDPGIERGRILRLADAAGRLRTWIVPRGFREAWFGPFARLRAFAAPSHPFWNETEAAPDDVDAGANARALAGFPRDPAFGRAADWLVSISSAGEEAAADKWYRSAWAVRRLVARALDCGADALAPARGTLQSAVAKEADALADGGAPLALAAALTTAVLVAASLSSVRVLAAALVERQAPDGGFARDAAWYGGPKRSVDWGSRELTTAFAVEGLTLARCRPQS